VRDADVFATKLFWRLRGHFENLLADDATISHIMLYLHSEGTLGENTMSYISISNWSAPDMSDDMIKDVAGKFIPLIMGVGASAVQMVRTDAQTVSVITHYADAATASAAQDQIAKIRAKAASDFPMTMLSTSAGDVFAAS
jgi:Asp/Glu/hydantoin racemase